jgi:hypothetical protein
MCRPPDRNIGRIQRCVCQRACLSPVTVGLCRKVPVEIKRGVRLPMCSVNAKRVPQDKRDAASGKGSGTVLGTEPTKGDSPWL